jgi:hypothetical protein
VTTCADAEGAAHAWINSRKVTLVGEGNPLTRGAVFLQQAITTPVHVLVTAPVPAGIAFGAEDPTMRAPVSLQVHGPTKSAASRGAIALVNEMLTVFTGAPVRVVTQEGDPVVIHMVDGISGPYYNPDGAGPRYTVDADWYVSPA